MIPVGPERDRAVAEMLGWREPRQFWPWDQVKWETERKGLLLHPNAMLPPTGPTAVRNIEIVPPYSTSPADAFEALELWRKADEARWVTITLGPAYVEVMLDEDDEDDGTIGQCRAPTFPDAATQALLRAGETNA